MSRFRKKPVEIEAFRWMLDVVPQWWRDAKDVNIEVHTGCALVPTLNGIARVQPGEWIIQGVAGELYPCRPDIFAATYVAIQVTQPVAGVTEAASVAKPETVSEFAAADKYAEKDGYILPQEAFLAGVEWARKQVAPAIDTKALVAEVIHYRELMRDLSDQLKFILREKFELHGEGYTFGTGDVSYLRGLSDAGVEDAKQLIEAIEKHEEIRVYLE